tara:strand:- start:3097 stop:3930 length:834 start_codon:yes stop_codon:yes gene_type:complete
MSIYGKIDADAFANTIAVTNDDATVTKNAADTVEVGDVLDILGVAYIVRTVTSTTSIELHTPYAGSTNAAVAAASVLRRTPPKAVAEFVIKGGDSRSRELVFVDDDTEAGLAENKSRGITGPGWWLYETYTTYNGDTRHKAECLAVVHATAAAAGDDTDDTIAADAASAVNITVQPADSTSSSGAGTFTLTTTTTGTPGTLTYQWQRQTATATVRWVDIAADTDSGITYADFTTATLAYSGLAADTLDGYKYRVKITSTGGTEEVISDGLATLTFGD